MATVSHSRLSTFEQCSLKYKYAYIDKIETEIETTVEAYMGDQVHRALHKLYDELKFEKLNTLQQLIDFYNENWDREWNDKILIVKQQYSAENYKKRGERMIRDYYKRYSPFDQSKTIALETQEMLPLDEDNSIHVRIDRLSVTPDGTFEIHDYKTSSSLKDQEALDEDRQLAVYAMGVKKLFPNAQRIELIWHFLDFDIEMRSARSEQKLDALKKDILQLIGKIDRTKEFEPKQSALCNYCEYQPICPLWKHKFKTQELPAEEFKREDGVKLVDEYAELKGQEAALSAKIEHIAENIRNYAEKNGVRSIFGSGEQVTIWSKATHKFPKDDEPLRGELVKALKALNLYEKFLKLDNWALEREFDSLNEIEKQVLLHFAKPERITRLYLKKK